MSLWTMIAVIVVAGTLGEVIKSYFKSQERAEKGDAKLNDRLQKYELEMEAMRKRIRNLEVIAAGAPDEFQSEDLSDPDKFDFESEDEFNEKLINQLARKKTRG
jgi:hypothetical protein